MKNDNTPFYLALVAFGLFGLILYLHSREKSQPAALGGTPESKDFITRQDVLEMLNSLGRKELKSEYAVDHTSSPY